MSRSAKSDRRAAIAAEIARRECESGVPAHLHVYALDRHHGDEGGPRIFIPIQWLKAAEDDDGADAPSDGSEYWPTILRKHLEQGEPLQFVLDPSRAYKRKGPPADYGLLYSGNDHLMIFSARAAEALDGLLSPCGRRVALQCPTHPLVGYRLEAVDDVLDVAKTRASWWGHSQRAQASSIYTYALRSEQLGRHAIFTVPQYWTPLVLQPFVDIVRSQGLTGFTFKKVWPAVGMAQWA